MGSASGNGWRSSGAPEMCSPKTATCGSTGAVLDFFVEEGCKKGKMETSWFSHFRGRSAEV